MFEFDMCNELYYKDVIKLRSLLEDVVERVYNPCVIDEEVEASIKKMADILGVYVPSFKTKFKKFGYDYIEDVLNFSFRPMDNFFYACWDNSKDAFNHLFVFNQQEVESLDLTEEDIKEFCESPTFLQRVENAKSYFAKLEEAKCAQKNA